MGLSEPVEKAVEEAVNAQKHWSSAFSVEKNLRNFKTEKERCNGNGYDGIDSKRNRERQGHAVYARRRCANGRVRSRIDSFQPSIRRYMSQLGVGNLATAVMPDVERYFKLRSM